MKEVQFDPEIVKAVHEINTKLEGRGVFAGSFGLKYNGYLDRDIHDIDVFTEESWIGTAEAESVLNKSSSGSFTVGGINVKSIKGETSNNILVDYLFKYQKLEYNVVDFYGVQIKIEKPEIAIKAKEDYLKRNSNPISNREKHEVDLRHINQLNSEDIKNFNDDLPF
jgi:hypothetical protein